MIEKTAWILPSAPTFVEQSLQTVWKALTAGQCHSKRPWTTRDKTSTARTNRPPISLAL